MEVKIAERKAQPALIGISGASGSGKTFSAILVAAGSVAKGEKVGLVDTENGRGEMYTGEPLIMEALKDAEPSGKYHIVRLDPPFSPSRYLQAIEALIQAGCKAIVIDSVSHAWEGEGGCMDIAENNKLNGMPNWALAKREHKRFINKLLTLPVHVICCLRAREKTKPEKGEDGKVKFVDYGMQPIQEKNFMFEMTFSVMLEPETHFPKILKCPGSLTNIFPTNGLITKTTGERIKAWSEGGVIIDLKSRELKGKLTSKAMDGKAELDKAWAMLNANLLAMAEPYKAELYKIAAEADSRPKDDPGRAELF